MLYADTDLENKLVVTNGERQRRGAIEGEGEKGGAPMGFHEITYDIFENCKAFNRIFNPNF